MDFYAHQRHARRATVHLVGWFSLALICFVGMLHTSAVVVLKLAGSSATPWWDPIMLAVAAGLALLVLGVHVWLKMETLKARAGVVIAARLGARPLNYVTAGKAERMVLNVVEEMAIAASLPVPWVYVLDQEPGINAFAAGWTPDTAVITVTNGALHTLSRDEMQGVMAHEFSHILHGDMRLNTQILGLLSGLTFFAAVGRWLVRLVMAAQLNPGDDRTALGFLMPVLLLLLAFMSFFLFGSGLFSADLMELFWAIPLVAGCLLVLVSGVGVFFSRLIQRAVARQREYLADAAAVQFTRYPEGLARALQKIGRHGLGSQILIPSAWRASHFFFANPAPPSFFSRLYESHPPLKKRVARLAVWPSAPPSGAPSSLPLTASNDHVNFIVGSTVERLDHGYAVQEHVPEPLYTWAHDPVGAQALVYGLLLDVDEAALQRQLAALDKKADPAVIEQVRDALPYLNTLPPHARLPLIELVMPALRSLSPLQLAQFYGLIGPLATADQRLSTFEFALYLLLKHWLAASAPSRRAPRIALHDVRPLLPDCAVVLSALAYLRDTEEKEAQRAFKVGSLSLPELDQPLALLPRNKVHHAEVEAALARLAGLSTSARRHVLDACVRCVLADGSVSVEEADLLRVIAVLLNSPLPPFLPLVR